MSEVPAMLELNQEESGLVEQIKAFLDSQNHEEFDLVKQRFNCLDALGIAISKYPSVRENHTLRGIQRNEDQLLNALCSFASSSHLLHIPARVVAARSYLVAKYQAFSLLHILAGHRKEFFSPLRKVILTVIHTLMAEEVYFTCLDDPEFSQEIKHNLANDLVSLWDSGTDPRSARHLPALDALWTARDSAPPAFGTMNATSELLRITIDLGEDWHEFLIAHVSVREARWALEEFLFGLSYEEIDSVRTRLIKFGINAVSHDEIHSYLGSHPAFGMINSSDYRAMYDFYVDRRDAAQFRRKLSAPGPSRTLEEIYIKYRITQE
ncbi:MAG: hypothetical protein LBH42_00440 [Treponema sp.]|nr:hypothetical protein [Treponema sp.]